MPQQVNSLRLARGTDRIAPTALGPQTEAPRYPMILIIGKVAYNPLGTAWQFYQRQ